MLVSLTWVMLGITLCHLDLVSCIGSLLGYKRIKNIRLFNLWTALIYIVKYSDVEKLEIILEIVLYIDGNAKNA